MNRLLEIGPDCPEYSDDLQDATRIYGLQILDYLQSRGDQVGDQMSAGVRNLL